MLNILLAAAVLQAAALAQTQYNQTAAFTAGSPAGKSLTMEDVILSREIYPRMTRAAFSGDDAYTLDGKLYNLSDGSLRGDSPASARSSLPEGAEEVVWSADGSTVYFMLGRNICTLQDGRTVVTVSPRCRDITIGRSVSRNEFGISGGLFPSPDGSHLAYFEKDESLVTEFPLLDITTRTGALKSIRYPMNGMASETVSLKVWSRTDGTTVTVKADEFTPERYLTCISWTPEGRSLLVNVLDRSQKHMKLNMYRASDGSLVRTLLTEDNDAFTEPSDPEVFLKGTGLFIYRTDNRDGFKNLYLCDTLGGIRRLTVTDADVKYVANDGQYVYYTSAEVSPVENHLFRVKVTSKGGLAKTGIGRPQRLTGEPGWHRIAMSPLCKAFIDRYSSFSQPGMTVLKDSGGKTLRILGESPDPLSEYATPAMQMGTVKSADGKYDNWYRLLLPVGFDPSKKYPVIVYVYGGPHSQMIRDSWLGQIRMWEMYMAQRGYIVYVQDNRGTENRGAAFEKAIHRRCGRAESEDQMKGIEFLKALPFVDSRRIGVHGWSYGGFMTITLMTKYPDVFKAGVAGGPVIDWKWYEVMYGERYMETPLTNPEGFAETSLIGKEDNLKGRLLICQGAVDGTVVWQHSLNFIQGCISKNIPVDYFPYPTAEHNVYGKDRVHLMNKVTEYFDLYL